jgi:transposase
MRKIKEVLRLRFEHQQSARQIAKSCGIARSTVKEYLDRAQKAAIPGPLPPEWDDATLENRLFPPTPRISPEKGQMPPMEYLHQERKKKGVTLQLLWHEYKQGNPEGYQYSQFCEIYRQWAEKLDVCLRQEYRAGEKLFVDYAGQTIPIPDSQTGGAREAYLFVATLGASNYTFAEATLSQDLPSWIQPHVHAFEFFHGLTEILVPDYVPWNRIGDDRSRNARKVLKGDDMTVNPGGSILAEDKAHKAMAAVGKGHDKGPGPLAFSRNRTHLHPRTAKIHLRLTSRLHLQPNRHRRRSELQLGAKKALHRAVTNPKPGLFPKQPPDLLSGQVFFSFSLPKQAINPFSVPNGLILPGSFAKKGGDLGFFQPVDQLAFRGERASSVYSCGFGQPDVLAGGVAVKPQGTPDSLETNSLMPLVNHLEDVVHEYLPPGHRCPPFNSHSDLKSTPDSGLALPEGRKVNYRDPGGEMR